MSTRKYYGVYRGVVVNRNSDSTYTLQVPAVYGDSNSPPALLCHQETTPSVLPSTGVFVMFEEGDLASPIVLGTWQ